MAKYCGKSYDTCTLGQNEGMQNLQMVLGLIEKTPKEGVTYPLAKEIIQTGFLENYRNM